MRFSLVHKIILVFSLLNVLVGMTAAFAVYHAHGDLLLTKTLSLLEVKAGQIQKEMNYRFESFLSALTFLSGTPPVEGIVRATQAGGVDPLDGSTLAHWYRRMEMIFRQFLVNNADYYQIRYIALGDGGQELVRVVRQEDGIHTVAPGMLQRGVGTDSFREVLTLSPGQIHLSEIKFDNASGGSSRPRSMMAALPVFNSANALFGMIVLDIDIGPLLDGLAVHAPGLHLTNEGGDDLLFPVGKTGSALQGKSPTRLQDDHPQWFAELAAIGPRRAMEVVSRSRVDGEQVLLLARMNLHRLLRHDFNLVMTMPRQEVLKDVYQARSRSITLILLLVLGSAGLVFLLSNRLLRPLHRITRAVEEFQQGDSPVHLPVRGQNEIVRLSRAFEAMTRRVYDSARELQERERRIATIMDTAHDGIIIFDQAGNIQSCNPAAACLLGYEASALPGRGLHTLWPPENQEGAQVPIPPGSLAWFPGGGAREVELCRADGSRMALELSLSAFEVNGQRQFTMLLHDIRERKQAEAALRQANEVLEQHVAERTCELREANTRLLAEMAERQRAEERNRLTAKVFENTSEAIVITRPNGVIVEVNNAFCTITGFSREEVIGETPRIGKSGVHDDSYYRKMWRDITETGAWSGEIWDRRKNGALFPKWLTINAVNDESGKISHFVGIFKDITEVKATEKRLERLAYYDGLTGLPNRALFRDRLEHEIQVARRQGTRLATLFLDLDRFKHVNDTLGHAAGDELLRIVAQRLVGCVREADTVARLGGDEFTVILTNVEQNGGVVRVCRNILEEIPRTMRISGSDVAVGTSIGVGIFPEDGEDFETLTKNADAAMYQSKTSGRNMFSFFTPEMNASIARKLAMETRLRQAVERDEFVLYYQPKVDFSNARIVGMEALVRWQDPQRGVISPAEFIPLAEETRLIVPLGRMILEKVCRSMKTWVDAGYADLKVAINLSPVQLRQDDLLADIERILAETGLAADRLEVEITENMMVDRMDEAVVLLNRLRRMGIHITMDDFGVGYASLSYLKRLPIDTLKIDRSFVEELVSDEDDAAIVAAIISLARSLDLTVVAEGVETREQAEFLRRQGCDQLQGYLCSQPLPEADFTLLLAEHRQGWNDGGRRTRCDTR
ncbi:MAG: EAL domain-containing protein [Magnetococcus sp. WYHC-3]